MHPMVRIIWLVRIIGSALVVTFGVAGMIAAIIAMAVPFQWFPNTSAMTAWEIMIQNWNVSLTDYWFGYAILPLLLVLGITTAIGFSRIGVEQTRAYMKELHN